MVEAWGSMNMRDSEDYPTTRPWFVPVGCFAIVVLAIAALVLFLVPVSVPYQVYEPTEHQVEKDAVYAVTKESARERVDILGGLVAQAFVTIENRDTQPATFIVDFTFETEYRRLEDSQSVFILPGKSDWVMGEVDIDVGEDWDWSKSITSMVTEIGYEWVTRHKNVRLYQKLFGLYEVETIP
jgi:hypothetical protein